MNLKDAIESGRAFRRETWDDSMWMHIAAGRDGEPEAQYKDGSKFVPFQDDLCAEDWILEPPAVLVTRASAFDAWNRAKERHGYTSATMRFSDFLLELGL